MRWGTYHDCGIGWRATRKRWKRATTMSRARKREQEKSQCGLPRLQSSLVHERTSTKLCRNGSTTSELYCFTHLSTILGSTALLDERLRDGRNDDWHLEESAMLMQVAPRFTSSIRETKRIRSNTQSFMPILPVHWTLAMSCSRRRH